MLLKLILLFTIVPVIELAILIKLGSHIGVGNTILIVIVTGVVGASLAKYQGLKTLYKVQQKLSVGQLPAGHILDAFLILAAGLLLLTPGLITDTIGFLILIPFTRSLIKEWCKKQFKKMIKTGNIKTVHFDSLKKGDWDESSPS